ncbi:MAG: carbon-nitrogen hydrolase [Sediminibacterium sp.]|nr:carbon-nitrogen hydrolase [Sediminibacterium sp.]
MSKVTIGYVQFFCSNISDDNLNRTLANIETLARQGAQIISTSELFLTPYFCDEERYENFDLAHYFNDQTSQKFQDLAKRLHVVIIYSFFEKRAPGVFHNSATVFDADGANLGLYRKMHIPDDPNYYEKFYFSPGDLGYKVFQTKFAKIGVLICWDQWFPEAARITSLSGAEILIYPTAIGWNTAQDKETNEMQYNAWQTIQRSHSIANGVFVVSVNRTGLEQNGQMQFWGGSFVSNPLGKLIYQSPHLTEDLPLVEIDLVEIDFYRVHWPYLRDRRIDSYNSITKRFIDETL